jgi:hypothetical protein
VEKLKVTGGIEGYHCTRNSTGVRAQFFKLGLRHVAHERNTNETKIKIDLNVDGSGEASFQPVWVLITCERLPGMEK